MCHLTVVSVVLWEGVKVDARVYFAIFTPEGLSVTGARGVMGGGGRVEGPGLVCRLARVISSK